MSPGVVVACGAAIAAMLWPLAIFLTRPHHNIDWISHGGRGFDGTFSIIDRMMCESSFRPGTPGRASAPKADLVDDAAYASSTTGSPTPIAPGATTDP